MHLKSVRTLCTLYHNDSRGKVRNADMLAEDRRKQVLDLVKGRGFITLTDLAQELGVSESTARRDLDHWQGRGVLQRIHGGAMSAEGGQGLPALEARANAQLAEKRRIAQAAAARMRDGDAILLDGGTTTLEVARLLVGRSLADRHQQPADRQPVRQQPRDGLWSCSAATSIPRPAWRWAR